MSSQSNPEAILSRTSLFDFRNNVIEIKVTFSDVGLPSEGSISISSMQKILIDFPYSKNYLYRYGMSNHD